jgi:ketosteroid isomerase-like protein
MSFDPMAAVVDWLDAYRSGDLESILDFYADDATIQCGSGGGTTITGSGALRAYWEQRLQDHPASELDDLQPAREGAAVTYLCHRLPIRCQFEFDSAGQIFFHNCGPSN